jgi:DNA replication protein DnaC
MKIFVGQIITKTLTNKENKNMLIEQTIAKLTSLRLTTMAKSLRRRLDNGEQHKMSPDEFLSCLVDDEVESRATKKIANLMKKANLRPEQASLENLRFEKTRGFSKKDIEPYYREDWIRRAEDMVFTGATGTGKSYLAEALVFQSCKLGFRAEKISFNKLLEEVRAHRALGQYSKFMKNMQRTAVLVVDDFAIDDNTSKQQYCEFLHILEDRTKRCSTIITSQYPTGKWHERIPDPTLADAICDRLIMGAWNLGFLGSSQRGRS